MAEVNPRVLGVKRTTRVLVREKVVLSVLALAVPLVALPVVPHLAQITRLGRLFDNSDSSFIWLYIWVI